MSTSWLGSFRRPLIALCAIVSILAPATGSSLLAQASPEQQLADRFAPIAYLRVQSADCDRDGEGYFPAPVEVVLGNPEIALKQSDGGHSGEDTVVKMAPTAQDLASAGDDHYLDFPGNPRHPGCTFESNFKRFAAAQGATPTAYAHIVIDEEAGKLILQYWFWYYFNDWNNTHESDWEMVQLVFDTTSVAEALAGEPEAVGFAQHGGGETADWSDDKLRRDGDRIAVYPAAGSHGTYYGNDIWIGWGEGGTGFGCDNSSPESVATPLTAVLVPDEIDPDGEFAWLLFEGRWGERQPWEYNGPQGPNLKGLWDDPYGAMDNWRTSSLSAPGGRGTTLGPTASEFFCNVSELGSKFLLQVGSQPRLFFSLIIGFFLGTVVLFLNKRHTIVDAYGFYLRRLRTFIPIGLVAVPIGIVLSIGNFLLHLIPPIDWLMSWLNDSAFARFVGSSLVGSVQHLIVTLLIAPPVVQTVLDIQSGLEPDLRRSFTVAYRRLPVLAGALVISSLTTTLLALTIIGIPLALIVGVRWQFFNQATILDGADSSRAALRRSWRSIKGQTVQAFSDTLVFQILALIPGPLIGAVLMVLGKASVGFANLFAGLVYAITIPISTIGLTLVYMRYRDRAGRVPAGQAAPDPETPLVPAESGA